MEDVKTKLSKLREERMAREKARIEKLRQINLTKYKTEESWPTRSTTSISLIKSSLKSAHDPVRNIATNSLKIPTKNHANQQDKATERKPLTVPVVPYRKSLYNVSSKPKTETYSAVNTGNVQKKNIMRPTAELKNKKAGVLNKVDVNDTEQKCAKLLPSNNIKRPDIAAKVSDKQPKPQPKPKENSKLPTKIDPKLSRKSVLPSKLPKSAEPTKIPSKSNAIPLRKSILPRATETESNVSNKRESVFDRLYKPKVITEKKVTDVEKLKSDIKFRAKVMRQSDMFINRHLAVFESKNSVPPVRRSISAVHFKRIKKSELPNCIHKWSSIDNNLNKLHLKETNEDETVKEEKVVSAVKSERKRVRFSKSFNFNTPRPEELQSRLKNWLQKRGKSLNSYHHLQCFGLHHLAQAEKDFNKNFDEENKENVEVDSDSDNDSYNEMTNNKEQWRTTSCISSLDDTVNTVNSEEMTMHETYDLINGALVDLTKLLREGFDWEQSARWLRAIRERFPSATETGAYWECRAALEEQQGNLPGSVECWEEAIAKGTERSVAEANLDQLLDKFMQLKISPNSVKKQVNPKMIDVKNVFKSTIIRFAVQQAKLRQSMQPETPKYLVTPVRRSSRLSMSARHSRNPARTPLVQICETMQDLDALFVPNKTLPSTP